MRVRPLTRLALTFAATFAAAGVGVSSASAQTNPGEAPPPAGSASVGEPPPAATPPPVATPPPPVAPPPATAPQVTPPPAGTAAGPNGQIYTPPVPPKPPEQERDGVRLRGGLSLNGGLLFYPGTGNIGGGGGLSLRLGVQFNHYFSLVYQNMPWIGGIATSNSANGFFFDFNSVLANLTLGHVFEIGAGPSFDLVYGLACSIVDTGPQCTTSQTNFAPAAHGRLAFHIGGLSGNGPRRSGLAISVDVHPFFPDGIVTLVATQAGVGFEWY